MESNELLKHAIKFTFTALPHDVAEKSPEAHHFNVYVELKSKDRWAVHTGYGDCYDSNLQSEYETLPSERTEAYKDHYRFPLDEAVEIAQRLAKTITIGNMNVEEYLEWWDEKHPED